MIFSQYLKIISPSFINEKSAEEISDIIRNITDTELLNKIESIISFPIIENRLDLFFENKNIPEKTKNSIKNFFISDKAPFIDKFQLIEDLENGLIKKLIFGLTNLDSLIDRKVKRTDLLKSFCNFLGALTDAKSGQGSTGTGSGEILLIVLVKDGYLPKTNGDINIFNIGAEVKSSQGRLGSFSSVDKQFTSNFLKKYNLNSDYDITSLQDLGGILNNKNKNIYLEFLTDYYLTRAKTSLERDIVKNSVKEIISDDWTSPKDFAKKVQKYFAINLFDSYKKESGFDLFLMFKESKNFFETDIVIIKDSKNLEKYMTFGMMGMTNGNQPVFSTVKVK